MPVGARQSGRGTSGQPRWADSWSAALAIALLSLSPFVVLSTAGILQASVQAADLRSSVTAMRLVTGLADATYAFAVVAAVELIRRVSRRRILLACTALAAVSALVAALAPDVGWFAAGRLLHAFATGTLLIVALPPLITGHGPGRVPRSVALVNLGLFGAATVGTPLGGLTAGPGQWRLLYAALAGVGLAATAVGLLAFPRDEPSDPHARLDVGTLLLAVAATALPFLGASLLGTTPGVAVALIGVGLAALVALVTVSYRARHPLMPASVLAHTLPVVGIGAAMLSGAAFTVLVELSVFRLERVDGLAPALAGAVPATAVVGMAVAVWLIERIVPTRWLPVLVLGGLLTLAAGAALLASAGHEPAVPVVAAAGLLLGVGAGAGVGPGLFLGGLSVPSPRLGPAFALVQLLRSEAAFVVGPLVLPLASGPAAISATATVVAVAAVVGVVLLTTVLLLGGSRPQAPDLATWVNGDGPAYRSPPLLAVLRRRRRGTSTRWG